jgi:COP9 signalosome complex subunit 1
MAVAEAKNSKDIRAYVRAVQALAKVAPDEKEAVFDQAWVDEKTRTVKAETERLEHELKGYKNNLIKESIRVCGLT